MVYCVTDGTRTFEGTKTEIISMLFTFWFDDEGKLYYKFLNRIMHREHSYSSEWTQKEKYLDVVSHLFRKIPEYRYRIYREI